MMNGSTQDKPKNHDKINDGPCAQQFAALEECAKTKDPRRYRTKLQACPAETDLLIKCINKHPLYFQEQ
jgi:ureidoglycolate hydrolase